MPNQEKQQSEATFKRPIREVRQWRIGTLSMGLLLVALGIILLVGKSNPAWSLGNLLQYWPVILIVLGLEMAMLNVLSSVKGSRFRFTYDVLSIIMVFIILISSSGMLVLESTGVMDVAHRALEGSQRYGKAETVVAIDDSIQSLVMSVEGSDKTVISTYPGIGNEVKITFLYRGVFSSQKETDEYIEDQFIGKERLGDTLVINLHPLTQGKFPRQGVTREVAIYVPQGLDVELSQDRGSIQAILNNPESRWTINHQSSRDLEISISSVTAGKLMVRETHELLGNIDWDESNKDDENSLIEAAKSWGKGPFILTVIHSSGKTIIRTK